jgi:NAD(P)-dependent dehydrogenase (short-subunit alcohol dehydrogenase family)
MFNPLDLTGKLILVTGASSGIGRATAIVLSKLGASVILNGRRVEQLHESASLMDTSAQHYIEPLDMRDVDAIPGWMQQLSTKYGRGFSGVVHSAGVGSTYPIRLLNREKMDEVMTVNTYAAMALLRGIASKGVSESGGSSVVLVTSIAGFVGGMGKTIYAASKAALHIAAKSAAVELAGKRIRVNCLAPAWVDTPLLRRAEIELPSGIPELRNRQVLGPIPPEDLGIAAAYLLSDAAGFVTGTTMVINGGYDY